MLINSKDVRKYGAKLLTVEVQPPKMAASYDMLAKAILPTEHETDVPLGTLKLTIYFAEKNRAALQRTMSSFMEQFSGSCILEEIRGYKGKYKGYLTDDSYTKTLELRKKILELTFDGYFFDKEKETIFDGKTAGKIYADFSRKSPCRIEVTAKSDLKNYKITLEGREYTVESLKTGKTVIIDGERGTVTIDGENAFGIVDMWTFPRLKPGENVLTFSSAQAKIRIRYKPMWL